MLKKFPVTSSNGYEYLVEINEYANIFDEEVVKIYLYKVEQTKGFFGGIKEKHILLNTSYFREEEAEFFDYVQAVKSTVTEYEKSASFIKCENHENNLKQFEEWDGVCK